MLVFEASGPSRSALPINTSCGALNQMPTKGTDVDFASVSTVARSEGLANTASVTTGQPARRTIFAWWLEHVVGLVTLDCWLQPRVVRQ